MIIDSPKLLFKNSPCEMMNKRNVIYKIENLTDGKIYIGKTTQELKVRLKQHMKNKVRTTYVESAIQKYGIEEFDVEVIAEAENEKELNELEMYWIKFYDCRAPKGYNCTDGGEGMTGHSPSQATRDKISATNKGYKHTEAALKKMSLHHKGHPMSETARKNQSESSWNKTAVRCVETGEVFESITAAAKNVGVRQTSISYVLDKENLTSKGYHWVTANGAGSSPARKKKITRRIPNKRKVICIETGEIFESIAEAAKWAGVNSSNIIFVLGKDNRTSGGYHWKYADEDKNEA